MELVIADSLSLDLRQFKFRILCYITDYYVVNVAG